MSIDIISYGGAFGGKHWLSFGPDMTVILIFSIMIYLLAMRYAIPEKLESLSS